ncbi:MAG: hypothetical protein QGG36_29915 [Pirellulaceae bacterium]|jgi:hypothetical protein|nr:hypothetical protein [Pirellulaceae bacterium]MDP7020052.1 hypothetical protein [Pirellulaceae bacterium]
MYGLYLLVALVGADPPPLQIHPLEGDGRRVEVLRALTAGERAAIPAGDVKSVEGRQLVTLTLAGAETPLFGKYRRVGRLLTFTPRRPLVYGNRYVARTVVSGELMKAVYRAPPRPPSAAPVVERIYPTSSALPANHLKFYIHFSKPMREGREIFDHFTLLNEDGQPVHDPWRRTELWSSDARRLTLWIHPGRVKQGLNLREDFGPVLVAGRRYRLVVKDKLRDATGQQLSKPFVKEFRAQAADHSRPLPAQWKIESPGAGERAALVVKFPEPLDHPLLYRFLRVVDERGESVDGKIEVSSGERKWTFQPRTAWRSGDYELQVSPLMEDLAGNTPTRVFDTDLAREPVARANLFVKFPVK